MRPFAWRASIWRWTVSRQILALVAVSILAAQAAGLIVLLTLPPRPQGAVAMDQAVSRIKDAMRHVGTAAGADAVREARTASDRRLDFTVATTPPLALQDPFSTRFAAQAAQALGLAADDVRVIAIEPGSGRGRRFARRPPPFDPGGPDSLGPGAGPDGPLPGGGAFQAGFGQSLNRAIGQQRPPGFVLRLGGRQDFRPREFQLFPRGRRGLAVKAGQHWLIVRSPPQSDDALWLRQVGLTFALTLAALLLPALWLAHRLAGRIRAFAEAADRFGRNADAPQLPEEGPYELRQAAGAFNRMQARIQRLVGDRTMMMAAVSHDLRTPLARVRFRIADLEPQVRDAIVEDIQQMDEMINQMLSFTRDALPGAERRRFDLSALVQSLVDDLADSGADVVFAGPDKLTADANLAAVRRILGNLLDNALKYAGHARVELKIDNDLALAIVEDRGPGVPPGMEEAIFEPFRRLEPSRNRRTGGVGLGLAIARNLARGHGGDIVLEPVEGGGARFVFSLPIG
jgi:signal transduction histidine kinase